MRDARCNEPEGTLLGLEEGGVGQGDARTKDLAGLVIRHHAVPHAMTDPGG